MTTMKKTSTQQTNNSGEGIFKRLKTASALTLPVLSFVASMALPTLAGAQDPAPNQLPTGGQLSQGSGSMTTNGNTLDINQTSNRAIWKWQSFDTGKDATVNIDQPYNSSWSVQQVIGKKTDPTKFYGTLNSNGNVMILDRNGVLFGKDARIDTAGIVASTGTLDDDKFMNHGSIELSDFGDGAVVNEGTISVQDGGLAALVAPTVVNNGVIEANMGEVALAGGTTKATVDMYGDGLVEFEVTDAAKKAIVENNGVINAAGGTIAMTTGGAKAVVDSVINMSGVATVSSASMEGGKIVLGGGAGTTVNVAGTLDASGTKGGEIKVTGDNINVAAAAELNAIATGAGETGGNIDISGGEIYVARGAVLDASASEIGDGGSVTVYADNNTVFSGSAYAMGGALEGDGGFIEISAKNEVGYDGSASTYAANGISGDFLIDPAYIVIHSGSLNNTNFVSSTSLATDLKNNANVTLQADNYIDVGTNTPATNVGTGDIDVSTSTTTTPAQLPPSSPACSGPGGGSNPNCLPSITNILAAGNLTLQSMIINLNKNLIVGSGNVTMNAGTINLGGTISGRSTVGGATSLLNDARLIGTSAVNTINVLSNAANIQQAVNFADDSTAVTDINVAAGTYNQTSSINLNKANVNFKGAKTGVDARLSSGLRTAGSAGETIIDFGGGSRQLAIAADNVTVDGFDIRNSGIDLVKTENVAGAASWDGIVVKNNMLHDVTGDEEGIQLKDTTGAIIERNNVFNTDGDGISIAENSVNGFIQDNEIYNTTSTNGQIYVYGSDNITIQRNYLHDITGNDAIKLGNDGFTDTNRFVGNVLNNRITGTYQDGIAVYSSGALISGNDISGSQSANGAIHIQSNNANLPTNVVIENNNIHDNSTRGIRVSKANNLTIRNNTFDNNTGAHVEIRAGQSAAQVNVTGNSFGTSGGFAVDNLGTGTLKADDNWWSTTSATAVQGRTSGLVDFSTYLGLGTDTDLTTKGFQGDFSNLYVTSLGAQTGAGTRIQDAVNTLTDGSLTGGARLVNVTSGTYNEQVSIAKDLTLKGAGEATTTITSPNTLTANATGHKGIISVYNTNNVTISDLTVDGLSKGNGNSDFSGIAYDNAGGSIHDVTVNNIISSPFDGAQSGRAIYANNHDAAARTLNIRDNTIANFQKNGIHITGAGLSSTIAGNTITGAGATSTIAQNGIVVQNGAVANVKENTISGIGYTPTTWAASSILLSFAGDDSKVHHNTVTGTGYDVGVYVEGSDGAQVYTNTITGSGDGIDVVDSDNVKVSGNTITDAAFDGIYYDGGNNAEVSGNTITGSDEDGIDFSAATGTILIDDNTVNGSGANGIKVDGVNGTALDMAQVTNNNIDGGGADQILVQNGSYVNVEKNTTTGTPTWSGISFHDQTNSRAYDNTIENNALVGIYAEGSDGIEIDDNTIANSRMAGVHVEGSSNAKVTNNTISSTTGDGINVGGAINSGGAASSGAVITGNTVTGAQGNGIYTLNASNSQINNNTVSNSILNNIWADGGSNATISNNVVTGTAAHAGVALRNVTGATITQNEITNSGYGIYADGNTTGVQANENSVTGVTTLVWNNGAPATINADGNYWGTTNQNTINSAMLGSVDFSTYLGFATDVDAVTKGFQADHSDLFVTILGAQTGANGRINDAIALLADGSLTGAARTIHVMAGNYAESVVVNKAANVRGWQADISAADGRTGDEASVNGVTISANDVTLNGFTVGANGVTVNNATGAKVLNNAINSTGDFGVLLNGSAGAQVSENAITGVGVNGAGIGLTGSTGATLSGNKIDIQNVAGADGIWNVNGSNDTTIDGNEITNAGRNGITLGAATGVDVTNNTISNSRADGIRIDGTSTVDAFTGNKFAGNDQHISYWNGNGADILIGEGTDNEFDVGTGLKLVEDMGLAELFTLEDMIDHRMDNVGYGLVRFGNDGEIYVTEGTLGIQNAINAADAGDRVIVDDGTYAEHLTINKALKLEGHGTTVQAVNSTPLITITADDVNIDPMTFDGLNISNYGIDANGADNLQVLGNTFLNFLIDAIHVENSNNIEIRGNIIHSVGNDGIDVRGGSSHDISDNVIGYTDIAGTISAGNGNIGNAGYGNGIMLSDSANTFGDESIINNNIIGQATYNGAQGGNGVQVSNSSFVKIAGAIGNIIKDVQGDGVSIKGGTNNNIIVENNTITDAERVGVYTENANNIAIQGNTISGNGRYAAIYGYQGFDLHITGNTINNVDEMGIYLQGVNTGIPGFSTITGNFIDNTGQNKKNSDGTNSGDGIRIVASNAWVTLNEIGNHGGNVSGNGISLLGAQPGAGVVVRGNTIVGVTEDGILGLSTNNLTIGGTGVAENNIITNVGGHGINLDGVNGATIVNNDITNAGVDGIHVLFGSGITVGGDTNAEGNTITAQQDGIEVRSTSGAVKVNRNDINATGSSANDHGIEIYGTTDAIVDRNRIDNAGGDGINVAQSSGVEITRNIISGTQNGSGITLGAAVSNSEIRGNTVTNAQLHGINVVGNHFGTLDILNNTVRGVITGDGITVTTSTDPVVTGNTIDIVAGNGISINGSANSKVKNNFIGVGADHISGNGDDSAIQGNGIFINQSDTAEVTGNLVAHANQNGINVVNSQLGTKINKNTINDSANNGIRVFASSDVTIGGANDTFANTINGTDAGWMHNGITVNGGSDNKVKYNTVNNAGGFGIGIDGSTDADVIGNKINNASFNGIQLYHANGATVDANVIIGAQTGIAAETSENLKIRGNFIGTSGNRVTNHGIELYYGAPHAIITGNTIFATNNGINVLNAGGQFNDDVTIGSLIAPNIIDGGVNGVYIDGGNHQTVTGNNIKNTSADGIYVQNLTGTNLIFGNELAGIGQDGIQAVNANNLTVSTNHITGTNTKAGAGANGILVTGNNNGTIEFNTITGGNGAGNVTGKAGAVLDGIHVENNRGVEVFGNVIRGGNAAPGLFGSGQGGVGAGGDGIDVSGSPEATINSNSIQAGNNVLLKRGGVGASGNGIIVTDSDGGINADGVQINNNFVLGNLLVRGATLNGIVLDHGNGGSASPVKPSVTGNTITYVGQDGIHIVETDNVQVGTNTITRTGGDGIDIFNSDDAVINANRITVAGGNGISMLLGEDVAITGNFIGDGLLSGAAQDGINVSGGTSVLIDNNTIRGGLLLLSGAGDNGIEVNGNLEAEITNNRILGGALFARGATNNGIYVNNSGAQGDNNLNGVVVTGNFVTGTALSNGAGDDGIIVINSGGGNGGTDALINGNTVNFAGDDAIDVSNSTNVQVSGNFIDDITNAGIRLTNIVRALVSANDIDDADTGIDVGNGLTSLDVEIDNNDIVNVDTGILADSVVQLRITDNRIDGRTGAGMGDYGIYVTGSPNAIIGGQGGTNINYIQDFDTGIHVDTSNGARVRWNDVSEFDTAGIYVGGSDDVRVRRNNVFNGVGDGIVVSGGQNAVVHRNTVDTVGGSGIFLSSTTNTQATRNDITDATVNGIYGFNLTSGNISQNTVGNVAGDTVYGIRLNGSSFVNVGSSLINGTNFTGNTVSGGTEAGILIDGGSFNTVLANDLTDGTDVGDLGDFGVDLFNNTTSFVTGNTITGRKIGVNVDGGTGNQVDQNILTGNGTAIRVINATDTDVINHATIDLNTVGIEVTGTSTGTTLHNNLITNGTTGILTSGSDVGTVTLTDNTLIDNATGIRLESGLIDMSDLVDENIISGGNIGLQMAPLVGFEDKLALVGDTLGATKFTQLNPGSWHIRLEDGAYFVGGVSYIIDALNVTFTNSQLVNFVPANSPYGPGILTLAQLQALENMIFDLDDSVGRGQIFVGTVPGLDESDLFPNGLGTFGPGGAGFQLTILGLPTVPGAASQSSLGAFLNNLTPFAGGDSSPEAMANIAPAAGGNAADLNNIAPASGETAGCWADVGTAVGSGAVSYNFSNSSADAMDAAAGCGG